MSNTYDLYTRNIQLDNRWPVCKFKITSGLMVSLGHMRHMKIEFSRVGIPIIIYFCAKNEQEKNIIHSLTLQ